MNYEKDVSVYKVMLVREKGIELSKEKLNSSDAVYELAKKLGFPDFAEEVFGVFSLDNKAGIVGYHEVSHGSLASSVVHPRELFKRLLIENAAGFIMVHNHPSGDPTPSSDDIETTKRIVEGANILGIKCLDHIVVGEDAYSSLKKMNLM